MKTREELFKEVWNDDSNSWEGNIPDLSLEAYVVNDNGIDDDTPVASLKIDDDENNTLDFYVNKLIRKIKFIGKEIPHFHIYFACSNEDDFTPEELDDYVSSRLDSQYSFDDIIYDSDDDNNQSIINEDIKKRKSLREIAPYDRGWFYGIKGILCDTHGYEDPDIYYKGNRYNYYDLEDALYDKFKDLVDNGEVKIPTGEDYDDVFSEWVNKNPEYAYEYLSNLTPIDTGYDDDYTDYVEDYKGKVDKFFDKNVFDTIPVSYKKDDAELEDKKEDNTKLVETYIAERRKRVIDKYRKLAHLSNTDKIDANNLNEWALNATSCLENYDIDDLKEVLCKDCEK